MKKNATHEDDGSPSQEDSRQHSRPTLPPTIAEVQMKIRRGFERLCGPNDDIEPEIHYLIKKSIKIVDQLHKHLIAKRYATSCTKRAEDFIRSRPFKDVDVVLRATHEASFLTLALVQLQALLLRKKEEQVNSVPNDIQTIQDCLKTLDSTILTSGLPYYNDYVNNLVSFLDRLLPIPPPSPASVQNCTTVKHPAPQISFPVKSLSQLSVDDFTKLRQEPDVQPFIIKNSIKHWPIFSKPSIMVYLRRKIAYRWLPVELGSSYTDDAWSQKIMQGLEFVDKYMLKAEGEGVKGYMAQHNIFSQIPQLKEDIRIPEYCDAKDEDQWAQVVVSGWLGPRDTVSPLHTDPDMNLFAQVMGCKYVRLYAPNQTPNMFPHQEAMLNNTSQVDLDKPDLAQFPLFMQATYVECIVEPGDLLFIPV
ncbi:Lysine-specific demethylase 8 [Chytridiales sp. JEL 0842]|nr:Lysine-specific demethylase 8 [Chytridiales sp. JEL 0842]